MHSLILHSVAISLILITKWTYTIGGNYRENKRKGEGHCVDGYFMNPRDLLLDLDLEFQILCLDQTFGDSISTATARYRISYSTFIQ